MKKYDISDKLEIIKKAILNAVPTLKIYLFGSYAYGKPTKNSDIDIYIIIPDDYKNSLTYMMEKTLSNINDNNFPFVDLFFVKESKYLRCIKYSSFEQNICKKGILLYEN